MAIFWIQQYIALPVIVEDIGMGDELSQPPPSAREVSQQNPFSPMIVVHPSHALSTTFGTHRQQHVSQSHYRNPNHFDLTTMNSAISDIQGRSMQQPHIAYQNIHPVVYQQSQGGQFMGQTNPLYGHQMFGAPYTVQNISNTTIAQGETRHGPYHHTPQSLPYHNFPTAQRFSYQIQPAVHSQQGSYLNLHPSGQYTAGYNASPSNNTQFPNLHPASHFDRGSYTSPYHSAHTGIIRRTSSNSSLPTSSLRGPPRKPKQSGYALWVGNLPPGTHIIDLKDHFAKDATADIESVFLISKSNCAFVNYKTETSCASAMARFHDSRFHGVRLVCRLRTGNTTHSGRRVAPSIAGESSGEESHPTADDKEPSASNEAPAEKEVSQPVEGSTKKVAEKYFVIKSLTLEDLERSVVNGIWATQSHNEEVFNRAYHSAENVYLIFSANKSGEYFGYARMASSIDDEAAANLEYPTRPTAPEPYPADLPVTILTPATATAPEGHIIDDSSRGTIFWEAHVAKKDDGNTSGDGEDADSSKPSDDPIATEPGLESSTTSQSQQTAFGKPFKVVWMSTERLPFYRTRGLRNPWNSNREVKIARDGTEIEPSVGRRLTAMFHRSIQQPHPGPATGINPMMYS